MKTGIQLYSVRQSMAKDPIATIRKVVQAGYRHIEVANHHADQDAGVGFGVSAREMRQLLSELDATVFSAHIFPLNPDEMGPVLEYHAEIGTRYLVQPMDFYFTKDDVLRKAEMLNRVGEVVKAAGLQLLYHNHFHEFQTFDGEEGFALLMRETSDDLVKIELDTYWTMRAGKDPVAVLKQYGERVRLIHQKDFPKGRDSEVDLLDTVNRNSIKVDMVYFNSVVANDTFTEIGTGLMDIQSVINVGNDVCRCDYIVLEQDYSEHDELESIKISMDSFEKYEGIEW